MKNRLGFTLIELLVALAIISILAAVGLASYRTSLKRSRDARRKADLEAVRSALELYRADNPATGYPSSTVPLSPTYINPVPTDPLDGDGTHSYSYSGGGATYSLCVAAWEVLTDPLCLTPP